MKDDVECPKCGDAGQIEEITGGMTQRVHWSKDDEIVKEEIIYDRSEKNSRYLCAGCEEELKD